MIKSSQITKGHLPFYCIFNVRQQSRFEHIVAKHISAASLKHVDVLTLLNMQRINDNAKKIWKDNYEVQYGLNDLPAWTTISEVEYQIIRHIIGHVLPTMAISTVKYDRKNEQSGVL